MHYLRGLAAAVAQADGASACVGGGAMTLCYSLGRNRFDASPVQRTAPTLRAFAADVLSKQRRAATKDRAGYLSAAFDGPRKKENALPRSWLACDVDGIDPGVFVEWRLHLTRWRGFGWPTARSTPEAPRERVIIELSEPVDREQGIAIGMLLSQDIAENFGTAVRIDPSTYRAEQPCFLPLIGALPFFLLGDPLDVPTYLEHAPAPPAPPPPATAEVALLADARMRWIVGVLGQAGLLRAPLANARGFAMACPWQRAHSEADPPGSTATALLFPAEGNGWRGGFRCLHAHCAQRGLRDLDAVLRKAAERRAAA